MKKYNRILTLMLIFIIIQPFFDILSFLKIRGIISLPISTLLKPLVTFTLILYLLITEKSTRKKWSLYLGLYSIYCLIHFFILYRLSIPIGTILHEMRFLLNIGYMLCIFIIFWYLYGATKDKQELYNKFKKSLLITMLLYASIVLLAILTGTSSLTYEYADANKIGFKGWFDSGQILGHAFSICLPFILISFSITKKLNKYIKYLFSLIIVLCMILLGTKVPYFMTILVPISLLFACLLIKVFNKKTKVNLFLVFYLVFITITCCLVYKTVPVYKNIQLNKMALNQSINSYSTKDDISGLSGLVYLKNMSNNNKYILNYYNWNKKASNKLTYLYKVGKLHPADSRKKQYIYNSSIYSYSSIEYKLFGIGYLNQTSGLSLESDLLMSFYCFGIIGSCLMLLFIALEFFKASLFILTNLKKIDLETYSLYIGVCAFIFISIFAGYTFIYTNFNIFLAIIIFLLKLKIRSIQGNPVLFIASTGGHLSELLQLEPLFKSHDSYIITEKTKSTKDLKNKYKKVNYLVFGTKDHKFKYIFKFIYNCFKSLILYMKIRPKTIITTGTHTAVPMCYIGKIFGSKIIFIETFANSKTKTLSGKLVYPISDVFIVQWKSMLKLYPKAIYGGWIY